MGVFWNSVFLSEPVSNRLDTLLDLDSEVALADVNGVFLDQVFQVG